MGARRIGQTAAMVTMATGGIFAKPLIMQKHPVACQAVPTTTTAVVLEDEQAQQIAHQHRSLIHKGELSFGTLLGLCTGYFIKKMGRLFALMIGMGFVCLQIMSAKGYVTVHWDRMQAGYNKQMDVDQDGRVTVRDVQSKWRKLINLLTKNIQFKSTFLAGLYAGIRFG
ncbi:FUN14 family-domain-containing protein [Zychaea mexicana]|uniref:FUN14 family-domain-containing protein n=1 Tax=Zychaea mexicana TaxID=64656 RepID=UPI0022FDCC11|nr:FUN14 family-domain-containing protein [Zychaea mexicana]KAI9489898.1 FUN14 family-domain-containing protein [Zychaea mexicana]